MTDIEYQNNRRTATLREIEEVGENHGALVALLGNRRRLVRIYTEDGAHRTAAIISTIDIPLIEDAIRIAVSAEGGPR